jgi:hypothetical protein
MGNYKNENYEIGYGKPPKSNQFVKGRSGNPKGRPKKTSLEEGRKEYDQHIMEMIFGEKYSISKNRKSQPYIIQLIQRIKADALKGNRYAQRILIDLLGAFLQCNDAERLKMKHIFYELNKSNLQNPKN